MLFPPASVAARLSVPRDPGAFRLFLAGLVFIHHFSRLGLGPYAVYVFFVLSGYWVQRMWVRQYAQTRSPYLTYMVSRVWRLAPTMMLASLVALVLGPPSGMPADWLAADNPLHLAFSSVFLLGYNQLSAAPVGPAWSLDIEMQYYLFAPLLALLAARFGPRWVLGAAVLLNAAVALALWPHAIVLPRYIGFFAAGMCAARLDWRPDARLAGWSAGVVIAAVVIVLASPWRSALLVGAHPGPWSWASPPLTVALAIATIPYAIYTTGRASDGTDRMMADLSYIVYLLHWPGVVWFQHITGPFSARLAVAGTSTVLVGAGSWLVWRFYDKPINRLRARWVASRVAGREESIEAPLAEPAAP